MDSHHAGGNAKLSENTEDMGFHGSLRNANDMAQ
jgi:hypothetical protein